MANSVVHFEISTADHEALGKFYSELFGWQTQSNSDLEYTMIDTASGSGINGGIGRADDEQSVKFYIEVPDLKVALDKISKLGGKTVTEPTEIPAVVTFAQFADPDGNILGLVKGGQDSPGVSPGSNPPVSWFEVLGKDAAQLQKFYSEVFGWKIKASDVDGDNYGEVEATEGSIAGGVSASRDGELEITLYAEVDDLKKYLDRAAELGAKTLVEPVDVDPKTSIAAFADPQGNRFGMYVRKTD